uniref:Guanylate cyclase activator 2B n=1 Tax=Canis lupus dingo TaxID=286419 RepID=A0A8C0JRT6_CANLU
FTGGGLWCTGVRGARHQLPPPSCPLSVAWTLRKNREGSVGCAHQGFQVQLESVKRLSDLQGTWVPSPRLQTQNLVPPECHHPALPTDLQPICTTREAASIFQALKAIASDDCELCVNVACTGCL